MQIEINADSKAKFYFTYYAQPVLILNESNPPYFTWHRYLDNYLLHNTGDDYGYLLLKSLSLISDEDAIQVARLAHQMPEGKFKILRREEDIIFIQTDFTKVGIRYFTSIRYKYGSICSQICFSATEKEKYKQYDNNIGGISMSAELPVPYIAIVDFLRSKQYALPWMGLSVKDQLQAKWIKLTT